MEIWDQGLCGTGKEWNRPIGGYWEDLCDKQILQTATKELLSSLIGTKNTGPTQKRFAVFKGGRTTKRYGHRAVIRTLGPRAQMATPRAPWRNRNLLQSFNYPLLDIPGDSCHHQGRGKDGLCLPRTLPTLGKDSGDSISFMFFGPGL